MGTSGGPEGGALGVAKEVMIMVLIFGLIILKIQGPRNSPSETRAVDDFGADPHFKNSCISGFNEKQQPDFFGL